MIVQLLVAASVINRITRPNFVHKLRIGCFTLKWEPLDDMGPPKLVLATEPTTQCSQQIMS